MKEYSFTLAYILLNGLSVLVINLVGNNIPIDAMIMLSSLYALVFFHMLNLSGLKALYKKLYENKALYLTMIVVFLIMWLVCFIIPIYYTPAILMFYATAWPSFFGAMKKYKDSREKSSQYMAIAIAATMLSFYIFLSNIYHGMDFIILIAGTLLAGITMFLYSKLSFDMNNMGFTPSQILASRFALLFLLPLLWCFKSGSIYEIDLNIAGLSLVVSLASLILPIYCSQISIKKVGPVNHSIAMGLTPFVAFVFEYFHLDDHGAISYDGYFSFILMLIIIAFPLTTIVRNRALKRDQAL